MIHGYWDNGIFEIPDLYFSAQPTTIAFPQVA